MALCGVVAAYILNAGARSALLQNEAFISFVRFLRSQIECFSMPLPRAIERCPQDILRGCGCSDARAEDASSFLCRCEVADAQSVEIMRRFAADIGRGYRDEQIALCDYCVSLLEERRQKLSASLPARIRMNGALCIAGALALVIMLV